MNTTQNLLVPAGVALAISVVMWLILSDVSNQGASVQPFSCNVALIDVQGNLDTYAAQQQVPTEETDPTQPDQAAQPPEPTSDSAYIVGSITAADMDPSVEAIVLTIDSPGGVPVAGEEIAEALKHAHKPTVALVRQTGTSAAYLAATGAQTIFAHRGSDVGSIGITMSYYDTTKKDAQDGFTYVPLFAGTYKEILNPADPLTANEHAILQEYLDKSLDDFVAQVATNRNLPEEKVRALANGLSYLAPEALQLGLIDYIGSIYDVKAYLAQQLGLASADDVALCTY